MAFNSVLSITMLHDTGLWVENKDKISNEKIKMSRSKAKGRKCCFHGHHRPSFTGSAPLTLAGTSPNPARG